MYVRSINLDLPQVFTDFNTSSYWSVFNNLYTGHICHIFLSNKFVYCPRLHATFSIFKGNSQGIEMTTFSYKFLLRTLSNRLTISPVFMSNFIVKKIGLKCIVSKWNNFVKFTWFCEILHRMFYIHRLEYFQQ